MAVDIRAEIQRLCTADPQPVERMWGGAGVVIGTESIPVDEGASYPPPDELVTEHASEASWLFEQLRDALAELVDFDNKFEFYGRLAAAGRKAVERNGNAPTWPQLRDTILDEAELMLAAPGSH